MYVPQHFRAPDLAAMHALIDTCPLAVLISQNDDGPIIDHVPVLIDPAAGPSGTLRGHVARANPLWRALADHADLTAVFTGPACYVSPSWYATKRIDGKVVPTWNYAVVHARGRARVMHDPAWLRTLVDDLTHRQESGFEVPWRVNDAPAAFIDTLVGHIVGFELPIGQITGKWKVSQNRPEADRRGVAAALRASGTDAGAAMAALIDAATGPLTT